MDSNLRTLEGALIRVVAFGSLTGRPVTAELADEVLDGLYPDLKPARAHTVREIQEQTCEAFGVSLEQLLSSSRAAPVTWPRQVAMYLARELTDQTLPAIGRAFGGRNHTTVMHACRRTAERIAAGSRGLRDGPPPHRAARRHRMSPARMEDSGGSSTGHVHGPAPCGSGDRSELVHTIHTP